MQLLYWQKDSLRDSVRFLLRTIHEQYLISARPVGTVGVCVGWTGGPTPHATFGEHCHKPSAKSGRDAAASVSGMERPQSGLPIFQSAEGRLARNSKPALGTDASSMSRGWGISADRRHERTGLQLPCGDGGSGAHWQRRRAWFV